MNEATQLCRNTGPWRSPGRAVLNSLRRMVAFLYLRHDLKCEGFYRFEDAEAATSYVDPASMLRIESSAGAGTEIKGNGGPGRAHRKDTAFWGLCRPESPCTYTYGTQNCCSQAILHPQWGWVPCMVMSWGHHEAFQCHWAPPIQPRSSAASFLSAPN